MYRLLATAPHLRPARSRARVDQYALGFIVRPDGSHQVTYHGRPQYLFSKDAYIGPPVDVGTQGIYGAGTQTPWGVFNTIPPLP